MARNKREDNPRRPDIKPFTTATPGKLPEPFTTRPKAAPRTGPTTLVRPGGFVDTAYYDTPEWHIERNKREALRRQRATERGEKFRPTVEIEDKFTDNFAANRASALNKARLEALSQQRNKEKKAKAGGRAENILTSRTDEPKSLLRGL